MSLSVVYLPAVLLVSAYWGLTLGLVTSLLSAAAFNFFHLPPTGRFTIADSRNWVALAAFMIVAVVVSTMAELARSRALEAERRRAEADLAAALARELLGGSETADALAVAARRVAEALGLPSAAIELGRGECGRAAACVRAAGAPTVPRSRRCSSPAAFQSRPSSGSRAQVVPALGGARRDRPAPRRDAGRRR